MKRKRFSRKEVQDILSKGATLHKDYTAQIKSKAVTGVEFNPKIYVLTDDTFLWVYDGEFYPKGKGDIFTRQEIEEYFSFIMEFQVRMTHNGLGLADVPALAVRQLKFSSNVQ